MLRESRGLHGLTIQATDGQIGSADELLFDDKHWTVRYLIVDTGGWLPGKKVLISPVAFGMLDWDRKTLDVNLTRDQIENSPSVESDEPVSRQWERGYYDYYVWPYYWGGMGAWGSYGYPGALVNQPIVAAKTQGADQSGDDHADPNLRSTKNVTGYGISATDGHLGHVQDFIVDDESWKISYLVVDTQDWWPGKKVLISPEWITRVSWPDRSVTVSVTREQVKNAPEWKNGQPVGSTFEKQLYSHYGKPNIFSSDQETFDEIEIRALRTKREKQMIPTEKMGAVESSAIIAVYDTHDEAETAIRDLQKMGFDMTKLSVVGKDYRIDESVVGYYTAGDRMKAWGTTGAFWGGIWSMLFGSAFFFVPGIGPLLAAGPVVIWIVGALESAIVVGGVGVLGAALYSIGIPNDSVIEYEKQIKAGKFLVIAHGAQSKQDQAMIALEATRHNGLERHAVPT